MTDKTEQWLSEIEARTSPTVDRAGLGTIQAAEDTLALVAAVRELTKLAPHYRSCPAVECRKCRTPIDWTTCLNGHEAEACDCGRDERINSATKAGGE